MHRSSSVGSIPFAQRHARQGSAPPRPGASSPAGAQGPGRAQADPDAPPWMPLDPALQQLLPLHLRDAQERYLCVGGDGRLEIWGRRVRGPTSWLARARSVLRLLEPGPDREVDSVLAAVSLDLAVWNGLAVLTQGAASRIGGRRKACVRVLEALLRCPRGGLTLGCRLFLRLTPELQWHVLQRHGPLLALIDRLLLQEQARILDALDERQGGGGEPLAWRERQDLVQLQHTLQNGFAALCAHAAGQGHWARLALLVERCPGWALEAVLDAVAFETHHLGLDKLSWAQPCLGRAIWARRLQQSGSGRARFAIELRFHDNPRLAWLHLKVEQAARFSPEREHLVLLSALGELAREASSGVRRATQDLANGLLQLARNGWSAQALGMGLLMIEPQDVAYRSAALQALQRAARLALSQGQAAMAEAFAAAARAADLADSGAPPQR